jgi:hypothetical protein
MWGFDFIFKATYTTLQVEMQKFVLDILLGGIGPLRKLIWQM